MLAKDQKDNRIKSFALDRLSRLETSEQTFLIPGDYSVEESYRYCFGIIQPTNEEPQEIILSFEPVQGKYIKSLPLHASQKVLADTEQEVRISLNVCVTYDLVMELLSYGEFVKVIQPASLIKEITNKYSKALARYRYEGG